MAVVFKKYPLPLAPLATMLRVSFLKSGTGTLGSGFGNCAITAIHPAQATHINSTFFMG